MENGAQSGAEGDGNIETENGAGKFITDRNSTVK